MSRLREVQGGGQREYPGGDQPRRERDANRVLRPDGAWEWDRQSGPRAARGVSIRSLQGHDRRTVGAVTGTRVRPGTLGWFVLSCCALALGAGTANAQSSPAKPRRQFVTFSLDNFTTQ